MDMGGEGGPSVGLGPAVLKSKQNNFNEMG
jgi:hypothetical protein